MHTLQVELTKHFNAILIGSFMAKKKSDVKKFDNPTFLLQLDDCTNEQNWMKYNFKRSTFKKILATID